MITILKLIGVGEELFLSSQQIMIAQNQLTPSHLSDLSWFSIAEAISQKTIDKEQFC